MTPAFLPADVVDGLLQFYRSNGIDMTYLLEDPIFQAMPVTQKIAFLKREGGTILQNSSAGLTPAQKKSLVTEALAGGATGAAGAAFAAAKILSKAIHNRALGKRTALIYGGLATAAGAGLAGGAGYLRYRQEQQHRNDLRKNLAAVGLSPTTVNAIGVLNASYRSKLNNPDRDLLYNKVMEVAPHLNGGGIFTLGWNSAMTGPEEHASQAYHVENERAQDEKELAAMLALREQIVKNQGK